MAKFNSISQIPIFDFDKLSEIELVDGIRSALHIYGFFGLCNISYPTIEEFIELETSARSFFNRNLDEKMLIEMPLYKVYFWIYEYM